MKILLIIAVLCTLTGCGSGDYPMETWALKNGKSISECLEKRGTPMVSGSVLSSQYTMSYCAYKDYK